MPAPATIPSELVQEVGHRALKDFQIQGCRVDLIGSFDSFDEHPLLLFEILCRKPHELQSGRDICPCSILV